MPLSWIIKTIPRSPRAFLALLVMLGSVSLLFSGLQQLFDPVDASTTQVAMKITVGLVLGLPATGIFYYFQSVDEAGRHEKHDVEILNNYVEAERRERVYKDSKATPVFDSRNGAVPSAATPTPQPGPTPAADNTRRPVA